MTKAPRLLSRTALLLLAPFALAACAEDGGDGPAASTAAEAEAPAAPATPTEPAAPATVYAPGDVPSIWMGIETDAQQTTSIVFAIDGALNGTPSDDTAVRITPIETGDGAGNCDINELERYDFASNGPVFNHNQANQGVLPSEIPRYLAFTASQAMVSAGLAADAEGTVPQNICTRKFWELWLSQAEPIEPGAGSGT
ncbi:MAG: hypothetical protein AAFP23_11160 [Pseudomonadota bacterium]